MNGNDDCRTYVEHLRVEHSHIDHTLEELRELLTSPAPGSADVSPPALLARLILLRDRLVHHFREEEQGGCLEEAQSRSPCLSEDVQALKTEHAGLLAELERIIAAANDLSQQSADFTSLRESFRDFLQKLHAHESAEERVLLMGFGSSAMDSLST